MGTYEKFLDGYTDKNKITKEEAENHLIVQIVHEYYENGDNE